jgi:hypothetical protein
MAKEAAGRLLIAKVRIRSEVSTRRICGGQFGTEKKCSTRTSLSLLSIIPIMPHIHSFMHYCFYIIFPTDSVV